MQPCEQRETIQEIRDKLRKQDELLDNLLGYHEEVRAFVKEAQPVIKAFNNISNAGDVVSKSIIGLAKIFIALGAIIGVVYAIKEWIKK